MNFLPSSVREIKIFFYAEDDASKNLPLQELCMGQILNLLIGYYQKILIMKSWLSNLFPSYQMTPTTTTFSPTGYTTNYCNSKPSKPVEINVDHPRMCSNLYDTYFTSTASDPYSTRTGAGTCVISFRCFQGFGNIPPRFRANNGLEYSCKLSPLVQQTMQRKPNSDCEMKSFHKCTNCSEHAHETLDDITRSKFNMSHSAPSALCSMGLYKGAVCGLMKQLSLIGNKTSGLAMNAAAAGISKTDIKEMNKCDAVENGTRAVPPTKSNNLKPHIPCKNPYISYILGCDNSDTEEGDDDTWDDSDEGENSMTYNTWSSEDCEQAASFPNHIWDEFGNGLPYPFFSMNSLEEPCETKFVDVASDSVLEECRIDSCHPESDFPTRVSDSPDYWSEDEEDCQKGESKPQCFNPLINYILGWPDSDVDLTDDRAEKNLLEPKDEDGSLQTKENENLWNEFVKSEDDYSLFYGSRHQSSVKENEFLKSRAKESSNCKVRKRSCPSRSRLH